MGDASLDGMGGLIIFDLGTLFSRRLVWRMVNLSAYLAYVGDVVLVPIGSGADDIKEEIERVDKHMLWFKKKDEKN